MVGPASERASDTSRPPSTRVKEHVVRDALCRRLGTMIEVPTPTSGSIDVLRKNEVIEAKHYRSHTKRVHLFAQEGDKIAAKYLQLATPVCSANGIEVTFEEVTRTKDGLTPEETRTKVTSAGPNTGQQRKNKQIWVVFHRRCPTRARNATTTPPLAAGSKHSFFLFSERFLVSAAIPGRQKSKGKAGCLLCTHADDDFK